jgi:hypothetical protein
MATLSRTLGLFHLVVEVVAFAGTLADAGEHRVAAVGLGDVVDQFHHVHGLADAGAAEQADLAALGERADQVDNLDAGGQQIGGGRQLVELRRLGVDRAQLAAGHRAGFVDRATQHVHDAAQRAGADRHRDRRAGALDRHAATQAVGRTERDGAHDAVAELLLDFESQTASALPESASSRVRAS